MNACICQKKKACICQKQILHKKSGDVCLFQSPKFRRKKHIMKIKQKLHALKSLKLNIPPNQLMSQSIFHLPEQKSLDSPLGGRPGLGTQPYYEAPDDLRVDYVKTQWLTSGEWGFPLDNGPKLAVEQPNSSY